MIAGVDASVLLLSHVIFQSRLISKDLLTVQTLHTAKAQKLLKTGNVLSFIIYTHKQYKLRFGCVATPCSHQERALYSKLHPFSTRKSVYLCSNLWLCAAAAGLLVQFPFQRIEELCAVDDVVGQADAERVLSGHVIEQQRPRKG